MITGELSKPLVFNRLQGYKRAISEQNLPIYPEWIIESHFHYDGGIEAMERLLALPNRPKAVFATSDSIAIAAYQAIW